MVHTILLSTEYTSEFLIFVLLYSPNFIDIFSNFQNDTSKKENIFSISAIYHKLILESVTKRPSMDFFNLEINKQNIL